MKFSKRVEQLQPSMTIEVMKQAARLKEQGEDVIDLGPGEPDFPTPDNVKEAGIAAIRANFTKYTDSSGILPLRKEVASKYKREWALDISPDEVLISCGAKHSIFNLCMTLLDAGDEVIIPAPYWVSFPEIAAMAGAKPVIVQTREQDGFVLDPDEMARAITPRTKLLLINSPNNPTGAVIPEAQVREIVAIARKHDIFVAFDEVYEKLIYSDSGAFSVLACRAEAPDRIIVLNAVSKAYSMTGWRLGYTVGPKALVQAMGKLQSQTTSNPVSISQKAAIEALGGPQESVALMREEYRKRRDYVLSVMHTMEGVRCARPEGAFYVFPNVQAFLGRPGMSDSLQFTSHLLSEAKIATVAGSGFGAEGYIRISYATSMENLQKAMQRMKECLAGLGHFLPTT
ncbi:MAG: pyridoxal phosphate-dependent aminotransferase [Acidobacteriota bacterium]